MADLLKIFAFGVLLFIAYLFIQSRVGDVSLFDVLSPRQSLHATEQELYDAGAGKSPYAGKVVISNNSTPTTGDTDREYIRLIAPIKNTAAINLTGWSLRSVVSQTRIYIPPATLLLKMTGGNTLQPVHLAPGEYAIVHTGHSPLEPVARSFHTNVCIGYLNEFNDFTPTLPRTCNNPSAILEPTPQNVRTYGATCIDWLNSAQRCKSYTNAMPAHLLPQCRELIARKLTYHSCLKDALEQHGYDAYNGGGWYLYLAHDGELWRNNYDAIQLLDAQGRVVDVLKY